MARFFFEENELEMKYVFWFSLQLLSETFLILRRNERDMIKNVYWSLCKVPFILVRFWWKLNFLDIFSKNTQMSNFIKIRPVGDELFHADWRTDRHDEANSHISQFCLRAKQTPYHFIFGPLLKERNNICLKSTTLQALGARQLRAMPSHYTQ